TIGLLPDVRRESHPAGPTHRSPRGAPANPPCPTPPTATGERCRQPSRGRPPNRRRSPPGLPASPGCGTRAALVAPGTGGPSGPTASPASGVAVLAEPP